MACSWLVRGWFVLSLEAENRACSWLVRGWLVAWRLRIVARGLSVTRRLEDKDRGVDIGFTVDRSWRGWMRIVARGLFVAQERGLVGFVLEDCGKQGGSWLARGCPGLCWRKAWGLIFF